jgi:hypothetical protein
MLNAGSGTAVLRPSPPPRLGRVRWRAGPTAESPPRAPASPVPVATWQLPRGARMPSPARARGRAGRLGARFGSQHAPQLTTLALARQGPGGEAAEHCALFCQSALRPSLRSVHQRAVPCTKSLRADGSAHWPALRMAHSSTSLRRWQFLDQAQDCGLCSRVPRSLCPLGRNGLSEPNRVT